MDVDNTNQVIQVLRQSLEPVARAQAIVDTVLSQQPRARQAGVLLALFAFEGATHLLFIRRAADLRAHSGEIAFPGGQMDMTDTSTVDTALREAQEEIGLDPARVEVLGILPPVLTVVSNYIVVPVVASLPHGPGELSLQASEVTELIVASLRDLMDPGIVHTEQWMRTGVPRTIYFYDYGPYRIWGATARMLNMLLGALGASIDTQVDA